MLFELEERPMRPLIGLIPLYDDEKECYWMLPGYMKVLERSSSNYASVNIR